MIDTKVAIVGAGLSGLSCAHELMRLGVTPDIFEKQRRIDRMFDIVETMLLQMELLADVDIFTFIRQELHLPLNPANPVTRIVLHSADAESTISGSLGYTTIRGADARSLDNQLARHVKAPIRFGQTPDVEQLRKRYDWVVVATGFSTWSKRLGVWSTDVAWSMQGANVQGDFHPGELHFFFETRLAGTGYAMIAPFDERTASVGVGLPDVEEVELERYWNLFRAELGPRFWERDIKQFKLDHYEMGRVSRRVIDNIVLVGNEGGFIEPLGITGQLSAACSGVYAARYIVQGSDEFAQYCRKWDAHYQNFWRLRRYVNAWTDTEMNRMVGLTGHGVGSLLTRLPFKLLDHSGRLLRTLPLADDASPEIGPQ